MQKTEAASVFELRAAKRGSRLGWKEADGSTVAYNKFIAHNKEPGTICWIDVDPELVEGLGNGDGKSEDEVLKHVPFDRPIAKNTLIVSCARDGMGKNATREAIDALTLDGSLYQWRKPRSGTQPEKYLARISQPLDPDGKEIFTSIFTAILPREHLREDDTERCSHLHPPLGGVNICREHLDHHEHQEGVALLSVDGTSAREDQPPALPAYPPPSQPTAPPMTTFPPMPETTAIPNPLPIPCPAPQAVKSKAIVRLINPPLQDSPPPEPDVINTPPPDTYQAALLELGGILLKKEDSTPWISLRKLSGQCIKHGVKLPRLDYTIRGLTDWAGDYFPKSGEIRGDRLKVTYQTRPSGSQRPPDLFFQFVKVCPDGSCN